MNVTYEICDGCASGQYHFPAGTTLDQKLEVLRVVQRVKRRDYERRKAIRRAIWAADDRGRRDQAERLLMALDRRITSGGLWIFRRNRS